MGLEKNNEQHYREVVDKFVAPNANYQMNTRDYVVRPSSQGVGPITITLPPVSEAKGRFYSIIARAASAVNTITIADRDDSECWDGDLTLNGKCDGVLLYSDGLSWIQILQPRYVSTETAGTAYASTAAPSSAAPTTAA